MMRIVTFTKKIGLTFLLGGVFVACNYAPAPKPVIGKQNDSATQKTGTTTRQKVSSSPGAVISQNSIQPVNDIEISQADGKKFKFADVKGKVVLVDIWATFCPPCREQAPKLAELNKKYRDKGLVIIGLNIDEEKDRDLVKMFIKQAGVNYTVAYANEKISRAFLDGTEDDSGLGAPIPQLFLISREGKVIEHLIGDDPRHSISQLEELIAKQLN